MVLLQSAVELIISQSESNSLLVFCVCNLIVALLFASRNGNDKHGTKSSTWLVGKFLFSSQTTAYVVEEETVQEEENDDDNKVVDELSEEEEEEEEEIKEDDLERRAEEFIERMNRVWRAERYEMLRLPVPVVA